MKPHSIDQGIYIENKTPDQTIQVSLLFTDVKNIAQVGWYEVKPGQTLPVDTGEFMRRWMWWAIWNPEAGAYAPAEDSDTQTSDSNGQVTYWHLRKKQAWVPPQQQTFNIRINDVRDLAIELYNDTGWEQYKSILTSQGFMPVWTSVWGVFPQNDSGTAWQRGAVAYLGQKHPLALDFF